MVDKRFRKKDRNIIEEHGGFDEENRGNEHVQEAGKFYSADNTNRKHAEKPTIL